MKVQRKEKRRLPRRTLLFRISVILAAVGLLLILSFVLRGCRKSEQTSVQTGRTSPRDNICDNFRDRRQFNS